MKVWVFVEGVSDRLALDALWAEWKTQLRQAGWGIHIIPLDDKSRFFRKMGPRAAEKIVADVSDLAVGLPDLYPNHPYKGTLYEHADLPALKSVQKRLVQGGLRNAFGRADTADLMKRFFPCAMKHDLEVLLLAAKGSLRNRLKTTERLDHWRKPPEDQDQNQPPKRVVESLFQAKLQRSYQDTRDAAAILSNTTLRNVLFDDRDDVQCPVFKSLVDWIGTRTGVAGY